VVSEPVNKGLRNDVTPFNIDNDNFPTLINAYQWRGRLKRKRGTSLLGRLTVQIDTSSIGVTGASPWTFNLYSSLTTPITPETNATIVPGTVQIFINPANVVGAIIAPGYTIATDCEVYTVPAGLTTGDQVTISGVTVQPGTGPDTINGGPYNNIEVLAGSFKIHKDSHTWGKWLAGGTWTKISGAIVFIDQGDGTLTSTTGGNSGTIDYLTGDVTLTHTGGAGVAVDATFDYYPALPVMGLEELALDFDPYPGTLAFDTKYAYIYVGVPGEGGGFQEYIPGTTWAANDYNFFVGGNYRGSAEGSRLLFVTNFLSSANNQMYYTDGNTWTLFNPAVTATNFLFSCQYIVPYYGRLLALNTIEGIDVISQTNVFNRCRFCSIH